MYGARSCSLLLSLSLSLLCVLIRSLAVWSPAKYLLVGSLLFRTCLRLRRCLCRYSDRQTGRVPNTHTAYHPCVVCSAHIDTHTRASRILHTHAHTCPSRFTCCPCVCVCVCVRGVSGSLRFVKLNELVALCDV